MANISGRWQQAGASADTWASANPQLLENEIGVESDTGKFKFGKYITDPETLEKRLAYWTELDYAGLGPEDIQSLIDDAEDNVYVLEVTDGSSDSEAILSDSSIKTDKGNMIIIRRLLCDSDSSDDKKWSYTSYVSDGENWRAMDGNYNAKNVYFDEDLVVTQSFGKYTTSSSNPNKTIPSTGMSMYDLIMDAYSEKKNPSKTNPKISAFSVTGNGNSNTSFEVGTSVTPQWTSTFNSGSYTYKSDADGSTPISPVSGTGVKSTAWEVKQGDTVIGTTEDGTAESSFIIGDGNNTDVSGTVGYSITASYSDGYYALTNLNTLPDTEVRITAGTTDAVTDTLSFVRKMFGGGTTADTVDSAIIRGEKSATASAISSSAPFEFSAIAGDNKVIFAYPKSLTTKTPKFEIFTMAWGETSGFVSSEVSVADARGTNEDGSLNNPMTYTVWTYTPAGAFAAAETKYRVYF